ncbi:MAG: GntR family transcriptional regulator [Alphaproteobacteria bacterium]
MGDAIPNKARQTMADTLTVELRAYILTGAVQPGQPLREETLGARFGCGRGPVREALSRLAERGFLVKQPFSGYAMRDLRVTDIRSYYKVRESIELLAIRSCWPLRDRSFQSNLRRLHGRLVAAVEAGEAIRSVDAEADFHAAVYVASGNEPLLRCWELLACYRDLYYVTLNRLRQDGRFLPAPMSASHQRLLDVLIGDSLEAALQATVEHLTMGLEQFERAHEEYTDRIDQLRWSHDPPGRSQGNGHVARRGGKRGADAGSRGS